MTAISTIRNFQKIRDFEKKFSDKEKDSDYFQIFSRYVQSSDGIHKLFKLVSTGCKWPLHFAEILHLPKLIVKKLSKVQKKFKLITKNLILPKYPKTLIDLNKSYQDYRNIEAEDVIRKRDKLAAKIVRSAADTSCLIQLGEILSLYSLGSLGKTVNFTTNFFILFFHCCSLKISTEDYLEHDRMQKVFPNQNKSLKRLNALFHEIKNLDSLSIAKTVSSIALSVFLILDIIFEITFISANSLPLLILSTAATVFSIWAHFYKESMTYPLVF